MFVRNPLIAGLDAFRSRASGTQVGGNGTGGSVSLALERVAVAEKNLQAARDAARAAARQAGVSLDGLFASGAYIARSTGERWRDEGFEAGRRKGEKMMADILTRSVDMDATDETSRFRHLARRLQKISPRDWPEHVAQMRAVVDGAELSSQNKGQAILAAGRRARMSADAAGEVPQPTGLAAQIVAAGKKARRPTGSDDE